MYVRITQRPEGEAPDWVRDAWIGLTLPTTHRTVRVWYGFGVLSGPHDAYRQWFSFFRRGRKQRVAGYRVNAKAAVDLLGVSHPQAAQWWREHVAVLLDGTRDFVFDAEACEWCDD